MSSGGSLESKWIGTECIGNMMSQKIGVHATCTGAIMYMLRECRRKQIWVH